MEKQELDMATCMYERDVRKGRLPVGLTDCFKYGTLGLCGPDAPCYKGCPDKDGQEVLK